MPVCALVALKSMTGSVTGRRLKCVGPSRLRLGFRPNVVIATLAIFTLSILSPLPLQARVIDLTDAQFQQWLTDLKPRLIKQGISLTTANSALSNLTIDREILPRLTNQPEHSRTAGQYVLSLVSMNRVNTGRDTLEQNRAILHEIARHHGVDATIVLAIWGVETSFGRFTGKSQIIRSLATLAASDSRRARFWEKELIAALKIVDMRDVTPNAMTGSWAGAMGHTQFMPTTYHAYAVDHDGDGRRDIWNSKPDALASTANYLKKSGWKSGEPWGFEVVLPHKFDFAFASPKSRAELAVWQSRGVVPARGPGWPPASGNLDLVLPSGAKGPAFLVTKNFHAIKRYNPSTLYALAVGQLADAIAGAPSLVTSWPTDDVPLSRVERMELQKLLARLDYDVGNPDGLIGAKTRAAIFAFQTANGLASDGHANKSLLVQLRRNARYGYVTGAVPR